MNKACNAIQRFLGVQQRQKEEHAAALLAAQASVDTVGVEIQRLKENQQLRERRNKMNT